MVMPPPVAPARPTPPAGWPGEWLPAADLRLDDERAATVSFDRHGRCRLTMALEGTAGDADIAALEEAADALPQLHLLDLDGVDDYPQRHAEVFGLPVPLTVDAFNRAAEVELVAPPGGRRLPARLGRYGLPLRGDRPATVPAPPAPGDGAVERALLGLGRRLVAVTRLPGPTLCAAVLGVAVAVFVVAFTRATWTMHDRFGTYGFDLGIYDQGTWLLSRPRAPFVTVRGLDLLGQHASYILALVAPLYRVWADPRLLLLLQVLVLAVLAADRRDHGTMALLLALAALCGEEVGLVVAGFGVLLVAGGRRTVGWRTVGAGVAWFLVATFVLIPVVNGRETRLFEAGYGITGGGPRGLLAGLPTMAGHALQTGLANDGLAYLLLVFVPLLGLPLLAPRWLLPVAPPLLLNLAAVQPEHHQIRFHYLATAAPLLAAGAVAGLAVVRRRRRRLLAPLLVLLVLVAGFMDWRFGSAPWSREPVAIPVGSADQARREALALVDPDAAVSAQYNLVPHLAHRSRIYEFPNPFRAVNWGLPDDTHPPAATEAVRFVVVQRDLLGTEDRDLLERLQADPAWRTRLDRDNVVLLERPGPIS